MKSTIVLLSVAASALASHNSPAKRHVHMASVHKRNATEASHLAKREAYTGTATWYDVTPNPGACGDWMQNWQDVVALNSPMLYAHGGYLPDTGKPADCYRSITIQANGVTSQAVIMDECPPCAWGSLDLSPNLFQKFAGLDQGVFQLTWWYNDEGGNNGGNNGGGNNNNPGPIPNCNGESYYSNDGDTCATIEAHFNVAAGTVKGANSFVNCNDIWKGTPICIPSGGNQPSNPSCNGQSYTSVKDDTCASLEAHFNLAAGAIKSANSFVTCTDIWVGTPLCIPAGGSTPPSGGDCASRYKSVDGDNCSKLETKFGLSAGAILAANSFLNCDDIWVNTDLCIPPGGSTTPPPTNDGCASTFIAGDNETCISVGNKFGLDATAIYNANTFVSCDDIWKGTPLCIPPGGSACTKTVISWPGANCQDIATASQTTVENIKLWNSFVNCDDIWTNTPLCVAH